MTHGHETARTARLFAVAWALARGQETLGGTSMKRDTVRANIRASCHQGIKMHWTAGSLAGLLCALAALPASGAELLWSTSWSNWTTIESVVWSVPPKNVEAADDFDVDGTIERIIVSGNNS